MFKLYRKKDKHNHLDGADNSEERNKWMKLIDKVSSSGLIDKISKLASWVDHMEKLGRDGTPFVATTGSQSIPPAKTLLFQVTSPANSTKTIYIDTVTGGTSGPMMLEVLRNATFSEPGAVASCRNREWAGLDDTPVRAKYLVSDSDITNGTAVVATYIATGLFTVEVDGTVVPANSDQTIYMKVTNISAVDIVVAINLTWSEAESRREDE